MGIVKKVKKMSKRKLPIIGLSVGLVGAVVAALAYFNVSVFKKLHGAVIYVPNLILVALKKSPLT